MAKQTIGIGTVADDGTGDPLRTAFDKANDNFDELYIKVPGAGVVSVASAKTLAVSNTLTFTGTDASSVAFGAGGTVLYSGGALGTPSSGTLTNATGLPAAGVVGTAAVLGANTFTGLQTLAAAGVSFGSSVLLLDSANVLKQVNGTSGQQFHIYATSSSANANYERLQISISTSEFVIDQGKAGTGSDRQLRIRAGTNLNLSSGSGFQISLDIAGTSKWVVNSSGNLVGVAGTTITAGVSVSDAVARLQAIPRSTTAALAAIANAINTANKFANKAVINTTTGLIVTAIDATAGGVWQALDGTTAHTPA